jgi:hypothetical protein
VIAAWAIGSLLLAAPEVSDTAPAGHRGLMVETSLGPAYNLLHGHHVYGMDTRFRLGGAIGAQGNHRLFGMLGGWGSFIEGQLPAYSVQVGLEYEYARQSWSLGLGFHWGHFGYLRASTDTVASVILYPGFVVSGSVELWRLSEWHALFVTTRLSLDLMARAVQGDWLYDVLLFGATVQLGYRY